MSGKLDPASRQHFLGGLAIAVVGAILFSAKAIVAKLIYRYPVDAVMLITFRMLFSLPLFVALAVWKARNEPSLSNRDRARIVVLGLLGYYLSSFLDFLGLQYISAGLERLILFLTPSFVLLMSFLFYRRRVTLLEWAALLISYLGTVLVFLHDVRLGGPNIGLGSALVLGAAISYALYLMLSGELLRRVGAMRLVAYAMCVSCVACILQYMLLRPWQVLLQQAPPVYGLSIFNACFARCCRYV